MAQSRPVIDESKYHLEFTHSKPCTPSTIEEARDVKKHFPYGVPRSASVAFAPGRRTTCEIFSAADFDEYLAKIKLAHGNVEAIKAARDQRPTPIVKAEATCSLFDNFSKKTGVIKSKGRAMKTLWHKLFVKTEA